MLGGKSAVRSDKDDDLPDVYMIFKTYIRYIYPSPNEVALDVDGNSAFIFEEV